MDDETSKIGDAETLGEAFAIRRQEIGLEFKNAFELLAVLFYERNGGVEGELPSVLDYIDAREYLLELEEDSQIVSLDVWEIVLTIYDQTGIQYQSHLTNEPCAKSPPLKIPWHLMSRVLSSWTEQHPQASDWFKDGKNLAWFKGVSRGLSAV